jgi:hypothetical protein
VIKGKKLVEFKNAHKIWGNIRLSHTNDPLYHNTKKLAVQIATPWI